jgi:flagellar protein FliO/FliZ
MIHCAAAFILLVTAASCSAADEPMRPAFKSSPTIDLWQWSLAMAMVLAAILVLAWLMRRFGSFSQLQPGKFRVLAALSLGAREKVVLLQAGEKQLVLGVAPGRVQTLCVLEGQDLIGAEAPISAPGPSFADKMNELMGRKQP